MKAAENFATLNIEKYNPDMLGKDGGNGWVVGTAQHAFTLASDRSSGNLGFTTQLFWDYYQFTKDPEILPHVYEILVNAARYITKCVELDDEGNYLVSYCDSPEVHVDGIWYYTKGTTYAQTFAYLNNYNALAAAKALGIDNHYGTIEVGKRSGIVNITGVDLENFTLTASAQAKRVL
jgi:alpha-L-fucosidase 2